MQEEGDGGETFFILELDDFGDQALLEALVEKVLRGEEALDTADGVPVRALVCSAATAAGSMEAVHDDESPAVVVPDGSGGDAATDDASAVDGDGGDGGGGSSTPSDADSGSSTTSNSNEPKARTAKRPRAVSAPVAGGIAAAGIGTLLFALLVGLRGQLRRKRRRSVGMKVSQAGANTVLPAGAGSPPPPPSY